MTGLLTYLDEQIEAIQSHLPEAVESFDSKGIHQARVATRRLKAGLDLLEPLISGSCLKPVSRAGKRIRKRLGPLRDLDVMIDHLAGTKLPARLRAAAEWISDRLDNQRRDARTDDYQNGKKPGKLLDQLDDWQRVRQKLESEAEGIDPLLRNALHERFAQFQQEAGWVSGLVEPPEDHGSVDVHQLRIAGKALRYTFELAEAHGLDVPKSVLKKFKAMQDSLGDWHDFVVLVETTLAQFTDHKLPLHAPELAADVLEVSKVFVQTANRSLAKFKAQWKQEGQTISRALHAAAPLTVDAAVSESETDPDRPQMPESQRPTDAAGVSAAAPSA